MTSDFLVPVNTAIKDFWEHLECHPRTILSAKYGDGKSFFIDAFMNDEDIKKEFQFIKLYPVNYQVLENRDIFEVIKYDILMQMGFQDMIDLSYNVSSSDAFFYCMENHGLDLMENLFDIAGNIEGVSLVKAIGKIGKSTVGFVKEIKDAAKEYKDYKAGNEAILDKYMDTADGIAIYEEDLITKIIKDNLEKWRLKEENKNKKVVLLIEDMDRIDPAHLFRIMNVFSAHMDYIYKLGIEADDTLAGNKFGFDNVVMVIHYENLESIFHHFYGQDTCFEGYIHKFANKGKFVYSLKTESLKHYYQCLQTITNIPEEQLRNVLSEGRLHNKTLRELSNSLDKAEKQRKTILNVTHDVALLMVCMRRLGMSDYEIVKCFHDSITQNVKMWISFLYPYFKHFDLLSGSSIYLKDDGGREYAYNIVEYNNIIDVHSLTIYGGSPFVGVGDFFYKVLSLVIK